MPQPKLQVLARYPQSDVAVLFAAYRMFGGRELAYGVGGQVGFDLRRLGDVDACWLERAVLEGVPAKRQRAQSAKVRAYCCFSESWASIAAPIRLEMEKTRPTMGTRSRRAAQKPKIRSPYSRSTT
jgi:hypothetical protein